MVTPAQQMAGNDVLSSGYASSFCTWVTIDDHSTDGLWRRGREKRALVDEVEPTAAALSLGNVSLIPFVLLTPVSVFATCWGVAARA